MKHILHVTVIIVMLYIVVSWFGFMVRNPVSNESHFFSHFKEVVTWKKVNYMQYWK